jgi:hypothetical protein
MSALYPVLTIDASVAAKVDGTALSSAADILDGLARDAGVMPLSHFISLADDDYGILDEAGIEPPVAEWFSTAQGLETVRALLDAVRKLPDADDAVISDLSALEQVLVEADARGAKWHLAADL